MAPSGDKSRKGRCIATSLFGCMVYTGTITAGTGSACCFSTGLSPGVLRLDGARMQRGGMPCATLPPEQM
jgi:hypothetical protein